MRDDTGAAPLGLAGRCRRAAAPQRSNGWRLTSAPPWSSCSARAVPTASSPTCSGCPRRRSAPVPATAWAGLARTSWPPPAPERSRTGCSASSPRPTPPARAPCCSRTPAAQDLGRDGRGAAARGSGRRGRLPRCPPALRNPRPRVERQQRAERRAGTQHWREWGSGAPRGRSSRAGGAIIIGAALLLRRVSCSSFVFTRGGATPETTAEGGGRRRPPPQRPRHPRPRPTTSCCRALPARRPSGLMRLFQANDGTVRFALAAQGVTANQSGQTALVQQAGRRLDPARRRQERRGRKRRADHRGPEQCGRREVPGVVRHLRLGAGHRGREGAKEPGKVLLSGDLPHSQSG